VIIEQAKGMLAERGQIDLAEAFNVLRAHARSRQQRLSDLARDVVAGATIPDSLLDRQQVKEERPHRR
jgi:AmiR/NasT family two-component response regulator